MEIYVEEKIDIICYVNNKKVIINNLDKRLQYTLSWFVFVYLFISDKKMMEKQMSETMLINLNRILQKLYTLQVLTKEKKRKFNSVVRFSDFVNPLKTIQLEVTQNCNFRCKHCYMGNYESDELKLYEIYRVIDESKKLGVQMICITGGEPLLRKDINEILKYITDKNIRCELYTNGFLLNENFCDFLDRIKINRIQISIDGHTSQIHDDFRGTKGSFDKNIKNIELLKKRNIPIMVTCVLHKKNIEKVKELRNLFENKLQVNFKFDYIIKTGNAENNYKDIGISIEQYCKAVLKISEDAINNMKDYNKHFCDVGKGFIYINSKGIVKLCPSIHEDYNYGNVKVESLQTIWHNKNNEYIEIDCSENRNCKYYKKCRGGCRSRALLLNQKLDSPDIILCKLMKMIEQKS